MSDDVSSRDGQVLSKKEAVEFWQREVHYYERRAGEQGVLANRVLTLAVALVVAVPVALTQFQKATPEIQLLIGVGVPAVVMLLLTNVFRLLHEMERLRRYVQHSEAELTRVAADDDALAAYRSWAEIGGKKDLPRRLTVALVILIIAIAGVGVVSFVVAIAESANPWSWVIITGCVVMAALVLSGLRSVYSHSNVVSDALTLARTKVSKLEPGSNDPPQEQAR